MRLLPRRVGGRQDADPNATNLLAADPRPDVEQVRRAIIDGRPGMPKGLVGGDNVDLVAQYLAGKLH